MDDIEFIIASPLSGASTYQNDLLIDKKIRLNRVGVKQFTTSVNQNWYWSFDSVTGTITVNPTWVLDEQVSIEVYGGQ